MPKTTEIAEPEEPPPSAVGNARIFAAFGPAAAKEVEVSYNRRNIRFGFKKQNMVGTYYRLRRENVVLIRLFLPKLIKLIECSYH